MFDVVSVVPDAVVFSVYRRFGFVRINAKSSD
jgi:hypothetical protein